MNEDLIGEEVVLTGSRAQISRLLAGATRVFLAAVQITEFDDERLDEDLRGAVEGSASTDSERVAATLRVTSEGLEVVVASMSDPSAAARTVTCTP